MKAEAINEFYSVNGEVKYVKEDEIFPKINKDPIYEIIRVVDGVPIFLEDHLARMFKSASLVKHEISLDEKEIRNSIKDILLHNEIKNTNIKLLSGEADGIGNIFLVYIVETFYPPKSYYEKGIETILYEYERNNPNAKVLVRSFKEDVGQRIKEKEVFEALIINRNGYIPEGSRSNLYFVKESKIYTAPSDEVLQGITRKHVFEIAKKLNIQIIEETVHKNDLEKMEGAFISGTGINTLAISKIENIELLSTGNKVILSLNEAFNEKMRDYVEQNKNFWI
ncbi:MAG: aminotransferase class IV [Tissierellia bacterium]|nr:aminotransferase class IV [Tissierellia bacterium]